MAHSLKISVDAKGRSEIDLDGKRLVNVAWLQITAHKGDNACVLLELTGPNLEFVSDEAEVMFLDSMRGLEA